MRDLYSVLCSEGDERYTQALKDYQLMMPQHLGLRNKPELCLRPTRLDPSFVVRLWRDAAALPTMNTTMSTRGSVAGSAKASDDDLIDDLLRRSRERAARRLQRAVRDAAFWHIGPYRGAINELRSMTALPTPHQKREKFTLTLNEARRTGSESEIQRRDAK